MTIGPTIENLRKKRAEEAALLEMLYALPTPTGGFDVNTPAELAQLETRGLRGREPYSERGMDFGRQRPDRGTIDVMPQQPAEFYAREVSRDLFGERATNDLFGYPQGTGNLVGDILTGGGMLGAIGATAPLTAWDAGAAAARGDYGDAALKSVFSLLEGAGLGELATGARGLRAVANEFPEAAQEVGQRVRGFLADESGSLPLPFKADDPAQARGAQIIDMLTSGRAGEITDEMLDLGDPVANARLGEYLFKNYDLPMDSASRRQRADQYFPDTAYHSTGIDFQEFIPSEFRGASFFGATPEGAARGASASANEGFGSGSTLTIPVRVDTSRVEGLGAYGRQDMNEFRASLPDRIYTEAEVDALMASDMAPRYGDWTYFFDDLTDYDALSKFRDANPDAPIPEGIIKFRPKQPLSYGPNLRSDISGKQFAHYSEGMSERPISDYTKSIGNTGFTMMDESGLALAMTDPTRVRSRFARFDPRLAHLKNLSAGVAPFGLLTLQPNEEQY